MIASPEHISTDKVQDLVAYILLTCQGPREAYGLLVCAILQVSKMNADITGITTSIDELVEEVTMSLRSIKQVDLQ